MGRPTEFKPEYVAQAVKLGRLGATDAELADFFGVDLRTIFRWRLDHEDFRHAVKIGKEQADAQVEKKLWDRAMGYSFDAVKVMQHNGQPVIIPYREHVPPDPTSMIFWLKNRRPAEWRDRKEMTSGDDAIQVVIKKVGADE